MDSNRNTCKKRVLLVGLWVNRNWILGNWIKEIQGRSQHKTRKWWVASVYANKHWWEKLVKWPLPKSDYYFFSYPSIFESYLKSNQNKYCGKSIVNYTHNLDELGNLQHQVKILNNALSVHFNCSRDLEALVSAGLNRNKTRLVLGAVDDDCEPSNTAREEQTIVLASKFSHRKGVEILPEIVAALPNWKFKILGRDWDKFIKSSGLSSASNVEYHHFDLLNRNKIMSSSKIFLSLSKLEGGPIPLLEAMYLGCIPIATDTGFAPDVIKEENGIILNNPPTTGEVVSAIKIAQTKKFKKSELIETLTWNRIANIFDQDIN